MHPDFRQFTDEQVDAAVCVALDEVDLPASYRVSVRALVRSRAQDWRTCCGGSCNPCIGRIEEAVDRARELLQSGALPARRSAERETVAGRADKRPPAAEPKSGATPTRKTAPVKASDDEDSEDRNWGLDYA